MSDDDLEGSELDAGETSDADISDEDIKHLEVLDALRRENADLKNRLLREMADMENLRKRTQREKADSSRFAVTKFAGDLLTVGDDLRRAIDAVPAEVRDKADVAAATLISGVEVTERQFLQILERHGVHRFEPMDEKFDPSVHEALFELPDPSKPNGTICQVIEAGYMIGDRVLRPARVGVAKGGPREAAPAATGTASHDVTADAPPESSEASTQAHAPDDLQPGPDGSPQTLQDTHQPDSETSVGGRIDRTA